jgi:hypothetical protein
VVKPGEAISSLPEQWLTGAAHNAGSILNLRKFYAENAAPHNEHIWHVLAPSTPELRSRFTRPINNK